MRVNVSLKTTETLLGIETRLLMTLAVRWLQSQNYWNPFRDWNVMTDKLEKQNDGLKTTETLLGIETFVWEYQKRGALVSKLLKPF